jgi:F0F1-type ATP synthase membrane subunit b/b'
MRPPSQAIQILGSILVALAIAAIAVAVVTAHFGPTSNAALEAKEERIDQRLDAREERLKQRQDAAEERRKARGD